MAGFTSSKTRSSHQRCSVKKVFLEFSQHSQENICSRVSFLIKLQTWCLIPAALLKKRLWNWCFPVNFLKFLRITFLTEHFWWLLLKNLNRHYTSFNQLTYRTIDHVLFLQFNFCNSCVYAALHCSMPKLLLILHLSIYYQGLNSKW